MRQSGDKIDADVADAGGTEPSDVGQRDGSSVQSADGGAFLVDKRLHAEADAIDAATDQRLQNFVGNRARRALDGDLG